MDLNPVKPFLCDDTTSTDLGPLWEKWKRSFDYFAIGKGVTDSRRKRALLLHCAGPQVQDIFDTLPDKGDDRNFDAAVTALDKHFNPLVNKFYERHKFRQMAQQDRDSVDQFIARLRQQAARCQYADTEQNLLDQLIEKCKNTKVRQQPRLPSPDCHLSTLWIQGTLCPQMQTQIATPNNRQETEERTCPLCRGRPNRGRRYGICICS